MCSLRSTEYCSDRRDRVYGLLGLAKDVQTGDIPIDYSKPLSKIWLDCIEFQVGHGQHPEDLLKFARILRILLLKPLSKADDNDSGSSASISPLPASHEDVAIGRRLRNRKNSLRINHNNRHRSNCSERQSE